MVGICCVQRKISRHPSRFSLSSVIVAAEIARRLDAFKFLAIPAAHAAALYAMDAPKTESYTRNSSRENSDMQKK